MVSVLFTIALLGSPQWFQAYLQSLSWSKLEAKSQSGPSESAEAVSCAGHSLVTTKCSVHVH